MDFAVCPACGQSVLDDDAEECPFCGSSMKAKPGSAPPRPVPKPAAKPAAATPAAPGKPVAPKPPRGTPPPKDAVGEDDLPFESHEPTAGVVQATKAPTKGRTLKVECPMCETAGYVPAKSAGEMVKCANPKCLVPLFKAPPPAPVAVEPEPKPKGNNLPVVAGVTLLVVGTLGAGAYYALTRRAPDQTVKQPSAEDLALIQNQGDAAPATGTVGADAKKPSPTNAQATAAANPVQAALAIAEEAVLVGGTQNRSKPFARMQAAESYALAGNLAEARNQTAVITRVGPEVPFYRIAPQVEIGWAELAAKNTAGATKAADAALADLPKLPAVGRNQHITAGRLATLLVALGRVDEATQAVAGHQDEWTGGLIDAEDQPKRLQRLDAELANLMQVAWESGDYRVSETYDLRPMLPEQFPQLTAVTESAVLRGYGVQALAFAKAQKSATARTEALAAWAAASVRTRKDLTAASLEAEMGDAAAGLGPAQLARIIARGGVEAARRGDATAPEWATAAAAKLDGVATPEAVAFGTTAQLLKLKIPTPTPLWDAAAAWAEIGRVRFLAGNAADAESSLTKSMEFLRGIGPALSPADERAANVEQANQATMREQLRDELGLKTAEQARLALSNYRRAISDLRQAAAERYELETHLLERAVELGTVGWLAKAAVDPTTRTAAPVEAPGLADWAATVVQEGGVSGATERQNFADHPGRLLGLIEARMTTAEKRQAFVTWLGENGGAKSFEPDRLLMTLALVDRAQPKVLVSMLTEGTNEQQRDLMSLVALTTLPAGGTLKADDWKKRLALVAQIGEIATREDTALYLSALAARDGQSGAIVAHVRSAVPQATEKTAWCKGLVGGQRQAKPAGGAAAAAVPSPAVQ